MNQSHSNVSISNPDEKVNTQKSNDNSNDITSVNTNISEDGENYSDISEETVGSFSLGSPAQQMRDNLKRYESGW